MLGSGWPRACAPCPPCSVSPPRSRRDPERKDWVCSQMPTAGNPRIDSDEIESARLDITEAAFNQEYLALFVNWEGSVFRRINEAATVAPTSEPEAGHQYVIGCDWGRSNDYTVFVVLDASARAVVALDRSNRVDYAVQCGRLRAVRDLWRPEEIIAEHNSIGQPVIEQLTRDGVRIDPFTTTHASKAQAIDAFALAFERGDIRIPNDPVMIGELVAYRSEVLPSGLVRYGAPTGQHDDTVMALAMAWHAASSQHRTIYPMPDSAIVVQDFPIPDHWAARLWAGCQMAHRGGHLGRARSAIGCIVSVQRILRGRRVGRPCGWHPFARRVDSRPDRRQANGRNQVDGSRLIQMYRGLGLALQTIDNPLESGVLNLWERMNSGRLKVFASLTRYLY